RARHHAARGGDVRLDRRPSESLRAGRRRPARLRASNRARAPRHRRAAEEAGSRMIRLMASTTLAVCAIAIPAAAQQTFTGRLSDSTCGVSHQSKRSTLTDRECLIACVHALAKYVLVEENGHVMPIANQDAAGLPLYAGRPVKLTGERSGDAIVVAKVEAIPAHLHLGHVMTNWRDTPGARGFLPVAVDESRVAALHAGLAAKSAGVQNIDDVRLHAGHVLNALDPAVEPKGPGAGYGVRKAVAGAL